LIIAGAELKLYSVEDISQPPRLLACFLLPFQVQSMYCHQVRADDALHNSDPQMQAEQTMWISDPKHRLLCIVVGLSISHVVFVISTGIFFDLGVFGGWEQRHHGRIGALQILVLSSNLLGSRGTPVYTGTELYIRSLRLAPWIEGYA
jgi:hypothetical protein